MQFSIGIDSHRSEMLDFARLGIALARRAWLNKDNIINTFSWERLKKMHL